MFILQKILHNIIFRAKMKNEQSQKHIHLLFFIFFIEKCFNMKTTLSASETYFSL